MISRIIKVTVGVASRSQRPRLITRTENLIILDITKTESNNCVVFRDRCCTNILISSSCNILYSKSPAVSLDKIFQTSSASNLVSKVNSGALGLIGRTLQMGSQLRIFIPYHHHNSIFKTIFIFFALYRHLFSSCQ